MPNWTKNIITSNAEVFKKYITKNENGEPIFDFEKILPMPAELQGITSPANIVSKEEMAKCFADYKEWQKTDMKKCKPRVNISLEFSNYLKQKYGADNWYDWRVKNWGTKWNAKNVILDESGNLKSFDTAWSPPSKIFEEIARIEKEDVSFILIFEGTGKIFEETFSCEGWHSNEHIATYHYEETDEGELEDEPVLDIYDDWLEYKELILEYI
jgi:hypothetical protein